MFFIRFLAVASLLLASVPSMPAWAQQQENIVLLPLQVPAGLQSKRDVYAAAIQNALRDKFNVFYGPTVEDALNREMAKTDCTVESCVQNVAIEFNGEIVVDATIEQLDTTYVLSLKFLNVITGELEESILTTCSDCTEAQLFSFVREQSATASLDSRRGLTALLEESGVVPVESEQLGNVSVVSEQSGEQTEAKPADASNESEQNLTADKINEEYNKAVAAAEAVNEAAKKQAEDNFKRVEKASDDAFTALLRGESPIQPEPKQSQPKKIVTPNPPSVRKNASVDFAKEKEGSNWWIYGIGALALAGGGGGGGGGGGETAASPTPSPIPDPTPSPTPDPTPEPLQQLEGDVVKGPLQGATVFLDYNDNGELDTGEPFTLTDTNGSYSFLVANANAPIVVVTDENTVDTSSGEVMSGLVLKAPQGSTVITPVTTLFADGEMTEAEVKASLGIEAEVDIKTFNPFKAETGSQIAVKLEKLALQIVSSANAISKVAQDEGVDQFEASRRAFASIIDSIEEKVEDGEQFDFTVQDDLDDIRAKAETELSEVISFNSDKRTALRGAMQTAKSTIETIDNLTSLAGESAKNIFRTAATIGVSIEQKKIADSDNDGIPDFIDFDRDNDGIEDFEDYYPEDVTRSANRDGDGLADNVDPLPDSANGMLGTAVSWTGNDSIRKNQRVLLEPSQSPDARFHRISTLSFDRDKKVPHRLAVGGSGQLEATASIETGVNNSQLTALVINIGRGDVSFFANEFDVNDGEVFQEQVGPRFIKFFTNSVFSDGDTVWMNNFLSEGNQTVKNGLFGVTETISESQYNHASFFSSNQVANPSQISANEIEFTGHSVGIYAASEYRKTVESDVSAFVNQSEGSFRLVNDNVRDPLNDERFDSLSFEVRVNDTLWSDGDTGWSLNLSEQHDGGEASRDQWLSDKGISLSDENHFFMVNRNQLSSFELSTELFGEGETLLGSWLLQSVMIGSQEGQGKFYLAAFGAESADFVNDSDNDGVADAFDSVEDRDGDGVADADDAFPNDASETADLDGDGTGDNADTDRDGDGVANAQDAFPSDASETADLDSDGIGDNADTDRDGDGVANAQDEFPSDASETADLDGDGIGDNADTDRDGDGLANASDALPNEAGNDIDNDGNRDADDGNNRMPFAATRYGYSNGYSANDYRKVDDVDGEVSYITLEHGDGSSRRIQIEHNINKIMTSGRAQIFSQNDTVTTINGYGHLTNYASGSYQGDTRMIMGGFTNSVVDDEGLVEYGIIRHDNLDDWGNTDGGDATIRTQATAFFFGTQAAVNAYQNVDPDVSFTGYSTGYFTKSSLNSGDPSVWTTSDISLDINVQSATFDLISSNTVTGGSEQALGNADARLDFSLAGAISSSNLMTVNSVSRTNTDYFSADLEPYLFSGKLFGEEGLFAGGSFGFATSDSTYLGSYGAYQYGADFDGDGIDNEDDRFVDRPQSEFASTASVLSASDNEMIYLDNPQNRSPQHYIPNGGNLVSSQYLPLIAFGVGTNYLTDAQSNGQNENNTDQWGTTYYGHQGKETADIYLFGKRAASEGSALEEFEYFKVDMDLDEEIFGQNTLEFNMNNSEAIHADTGLLHLAKYTRNDGFSSNGTTMIGSNFNSSYLPSFATFGAYLVGEYNGTDYISSSSQGQVAMDLNKYGGAFHDGIRSSVIRCDYWCNRVSEGVSYVQENSPARFKGKSSGLYYLGSDFAGTTNAPAAAATGPVFTTSDVWLDVVFSYNNGKLYSGNTQISANGSSWSSDADLDFEVTIGEMLVQGQSNSLFRGNLTNDVNARKVYERFGNYNSGNFAAYFYGENADEMAGHWQMIGEAGFYQAAFGTRELNYYSVSEGTNDSIFEANRLTAINIPTNAFQDRDRSYAMHSLDFSISTDGNFDLTKFSETGLVTNSSHWECDDGSCTVLDGLGAEFVHGPNEGDGLTYARFQINYDANFEFNTGSGDTVNVSSSTASEFTKFVNDNDNVTVLAGQFDGSFSDFHIYGTMIQNSPNSSWQSRISSFHDGVRTGDSDIPDSGLHQFTGHSVGVFLEDGVGERMTRSDVLLEINFSTRAVTLNSASTEIANFGTDSWQEKSSLNFTHNDLGFNSGANWVTERNSVSNFAPDGEFADGSGTVYANFYGENAEEIAGTWQFNEADKFYQAAFGAKR